MKMRYAALLFLAAFFLQGTLLNLFSIYGITPNLILCLVAIFSFLYDDINGAVFGVIFGLLSDLCMAQYLGISALSYLLVALAVIGLRESINKENIISIFIVSGGATVVYNLTYFLIRICFGNSYSIMYWLKLQPICLIYNLVIIFMLYLIFIKRVVKYRNDRYLIWKK